MSLVTASQGAARSSRTERAHLPRRLGKYRVLLELGRGGMATVFLAMTRSAPGVSKLVVLKALLPEYAAESDARAMFLDEARLAAQLNHSNVVQTYEVGQEQDYQVIVMEYLEGQSLAALLKRGQKQGKPLPLGLHLRVLLQVLEGLHYTHELRGYDGAALNPVHRDVSPQNVFITYDGRAKLLDFGIAKAASSTTRTATGLVKGKIAYMAPEQMAGDAVDRRADVYAVGCMLWAAAAGRKLWSDLTDVNIMHEVVSEAIPSPRSRNPDCDPELERIIMKALSRVESRYASALELHDDLERFCDSRAIVDRPRELAKFVSELFAEDRAELRARIESELAQIESSAGVESDGGLKSGVGPTLPGLPYSPDATQTDADNQQLTSSSRTFASTVNARPLKANRKWPHWGWLAAGAAVLVAGVYLLVRPRPEPALTASPDVKPAPPVAAPTPDSIKATLRSTPPTAQLFVDDKPLPGNPALEVFTKDGSTHRVRAELAGYRTASAELVASGDQELVLTLQEIGAEAKDAKPHAAARGPAKPKTSKVAAPAPKAARCAQPFYIAPDGIKKIKPECL